MSIVDVRVPASRYEVGDWPDLRDGATRSELTPVSIQAMVRLGEAWNLSVAEIVDLLGGVAQSTWYAWQQSSSKKPLTADQLTRVSLLLGIYTSLRILHDGPLANEWVQRPNRNPIFGGRTPLQAMIEGGIPVMVEVRALLDGRRGGL